MTTTKIGSTGVTFPDTTLQTTSGVTLVNGKGPGVIQSVITSGTVIPTTSGTSFTFSSIPNWVKRITVLLSNVSTNGSSAPQIQIGSGSIDYTGYLSAATALNNNTSILTSNSTTGFLIAAGGAASDVRHGAATLSLLGSNVWIISGSLGYSSVAVTTVFGGYKALAGVLDRVMLTTNNFTDQFDAGSVNILYE